jgi:FERM central domain
VLSVMASWPAGEEAKFVLTVKLFTPALMNSVDPKVIYLFYIQGVYNVITGIYPTGMDESVSLAALQMQAKFGDHNPTVYAHPYHPTPHCCAKMACRLWCFVPSQARPRLLVPSAQGPPTRTHHAQEDAVSMGNRNFVSAFVTAA